MPRNPDSLISILQRIEGLLRKGNHPQADYVAAIIEIAEWDCLAMDPALTSGAFWGGSGSVFEVGEFDENQDRRSFHQALVELAAEMQAQGIKSESAASGAAILASWLEQRL